MIKVFTQPLGPVEANCYVVVKDHHALVIDPGDDFSALKRLLTEEEATLDAILLTHAHFDHIEEYGVDVYMNPKEFDFLDNMRLNGSAYFYAKVKSHAVPKAVHDGMQKIGAFEVEAKTLPGHSVGSTIYRIEDALFTGDVLFQGSVGRVDLPTGSERDMMASIQYLKTLPQDLVVYPGHGPATTIGQELRWNPYFR